MRAFQRSYLPQDSIYPLRGVNYEDPSTLLDPRFSPESLNVEVARGIGEKRKGYAQIGDSLDGSPIMALVDFEELDGSRHFVALTQKRQYRLDTSDDSWVDLTPGGSEWTGGDEDSIQWIIVTDDNGRRLIATNGVDKPREWTGSGDFTDVGWNISGFVTCKALGVFFDRLVIGNITTTARFPNDVAWSVVGDFDDFQGSGSGGATLADIDGELLRAEKFGNKLALYSDNSIAMMIYAGGTVIFAFEVVAEGTRLLSPGAVVNLGPFHVFASRNTFFLFDGSRMLLDVGRRVSKRYREELDLERARLSSAFLYASRQEAWFFVPVASGHRVYLLEYDVSDPQRMVWNPFEFGHDQNIASTFQRDESLTYDSSQIDGLTYEEVGFAYSDGSMRAGFPVRVFGGWDGKVYRYDGSRVRDDGETVEARWDSMDFVVPEAYISEKGRWVEIELEAKGTQLDVYYSTNLGLETEFIRTLELTSAWARYVISVDVTSPTFRVSLRNEEPRGVMEFRWLRVWVRPAGAR